MYETLALVKRHMLRFLRDRVAVFFSFLSVMILIALYFLFIGRQYTSGGALDSITDEALKTQLVVGVMMGGVLVINSLSLSLGMMGNVIEDLNNQTLDAFLVTPIKRRHIIISYYLAANIVTISLSLFMWIITILYAGIFADAWYSFSVILKVSGLLVFYTFISSSLMLYLTTLLKSVNAFGILSGVLGTFIGFLSGIYMPLAVLGNSMKNVASIVPFTHMTILLKRILLDGPLEDLSLLVQNEEAMAQIRSSYGVNFIHVLGLDVSIYVIFLVIILLAVMMLFLAFKNMTRKFSR